MTLTPLLTAPMAVQIHVACALTALALAPLILIRRKGDRIHRLAGRLWVAAMAGAALSSFLITEMQMIGPFGPIHLLSVLTLQGLWQAVALARAGRIAEHARAMRSLAVLALGVPGLFTLLPGRRMSLILAPDAPWLAFGMAALVLGGLVLWLRRPRRDPLPFPRASR